MSELEKITESSGNVFEDIGFDKAEARALLLRSRLMVQLEKALRAQHATQAALGRQLGIGQSRVSDLLKGKAELFSLDMLVTLAARLGLPVDLAVAPASRQQSLRVFVSTTTVHGGAITFSSGVTSSPVIYRSGTRPFDAAGSKGMDIHAGLSTVPVDGTASNQSLPESLWRPRAA